MLNYKIQSRVETDEDTGSPLFWHNQDGWVELDSATTFSEKDTEWMSLPAMSKWVVHIKVTNIEWDIDEQDGEEPPVLPLCVDCFLSGEITNDLAEIDEMVDDYLSNTYGFCVHSCHYAS